MTYIILHGTDWHETFDTFEEAEVYYDELVRDDGDYFDFTLCTVNKAHEATKQMEYSNIHKHWNLDYGAGTKDKGR